MEVKILSIFFSKITKYRRISFIKKAKSQVKNFCLNKTVILHSNLQIYENQVFKKKKST
jgi:hypothetical protein